MRFEVLVRVALAVACLQSPATAAQTEEALRVAIIKSSTVGPFEQATAAMADELSKRSPQPEILTFDLDGDSANATGIRRKIEDALPQLVVTVGTLATTTMLQSPGTLPIVFTMVLYPEQSGFLKASTHPITGVSLDIPTATQFRYLRDLLPSARRVGVLYSPEETGSIVAKGRSDASSYGFEVDAVPVTRTADVIHSLADLLNKVDALWSVADSNVFTPQSTSAIILAALREGIPLFGISTAQVRAGAVMGLSVDYADIGRQTADYVWRVLGGAKVESLPIALPRKVLMTLNEKTARHIGLTIPPQLRATASEVFQ